MKAIVRGVAAAVAGYAVIAIITTVIFEGLLGGVSYRGSSPWELAVASVGAVVAGLAGGSLAGWLGRPAALRHALYVLVPLALDSTYVLTSGISQDALWYDLIAACTLMLATVVGGALIARCCVPGSAVAGSAGS